MAKQRDRKPAVRDRRMRLILILLVSCGVGVMSGMFGVGGGVILVPLLVLLFAFDQHTAQGTSLMALVPPTGLLAFINYARVGEVNWLVGSLVMPGVFLGAVFGSRLAQRLPSKKMTQACAALLLLLGAWETLSAVMGR